MATIKKDVQTSEKTQSKQEQDEKAALRAELEPKPTAAAKKDAQDEFADYKAPENEKHLFHLSLEKVLFNSKTGQKASKPYVQKFTESEYKDLLVHGAGFTINVLHDPTAPTAEDGLA